MIFKKKSLIVASVSGLTICLVLVMTLVGYAGYLELKHERFKRSYRHVLKKALLNSYAKHVKALKLRARIDDAGPLKGRPIIEGELQNGGNRTITDILLKVKFLDPGGAIIYEVVFMPQDPSLGRSGVPDINIPYITKPIRASIKPGGSLPFKKILEGCPDEIRKELEKTRPSAKPPQKAAEAIQCEIISLEISSSSPA